MAKWPPDLATFEVFLFKAGLVLSKEGEPDPSSFGNFWQEYSNDDLMVSMGYDRESYVTVSARGSHPQDRYDPAILRELLGRKGSEVAPLKEEIAFLIGAWPDIVKTFSRSESEVSRERLVELRKARARRLLLGLRTRPDDHERSG